MASCQLDASLKSPALRPIRFSTLPIEQSDSRKAPAYLQLKSDLDERASSVSQAILVASLIENINIRGRVIEYLITGEDESTRQAMIERLIRNDGELPRFRTSNELGDYFRNFDNYDTATDVKTKVMILNSNPKAYNIDKLLEYLSNDQTVFMFYFIGIEPNKIVNRVLVSIFQEDLLDSTIVLRHWAGRNSRGVTQFKGSALDNLIQSPNNRINRGASEDFLRELIDL